MHRRQLPTLRPPGRPTEPPETTRESGHKRSNDALNREGMRLLRNLGLAVEAQEIRSFLGWEQEPRPSKRLNHNFAEL